MNIKKKIYQKINKIFNNETIRTGWDKEDEKYYKQSLREEGNETVTKCHQLKLKLSL